MDHISLTMHGGLKIYVPRPISCMSTYVLLEQEDWFEKEIGFVRRILRPGMRVLDIGANHGVYTLSMAKAVGGQGAVWSYEPASTTAELLRKSVESNAFTHVTVCQRALSNRQGTAHLRLESSSELNALSSDAASGSEDVQLSTLDQELEMQKFGTVDFVKLDAEGEETNIVAGGEKFFATQSPLVMFELKDAKTVHTELLEAFVARGYGLYRLIGPEWLLVPFRMDEPVDAYELNLFACKPDRAAALAKAGYLIESRTQSAAVPGAGLAFWRRQQFASAFGAADRDIDPAYSAALDQYAAWRDEGHPLSERVGALTASFEAMLALVQNSNNLAMLSTFARTAIEVGQRNVAVQCLGRMVQMMGGKRPQVNAPFWPAGARYDAISPQAPVEDWFAASVIETFERLRGLSSYFVRPNTLSLLDWLQKTPYASAEIERRRQLSRLRVGMQKRIDPAAIVTTESRDNLNADYWRATQAPAA